MPSVAFDAVCDIINEYRGNDAEDDQRIAMELTDFYLFEDTIEWSKSYDQKWKVEAKVRILNDKYPILTGYGSTKTEALIDLIRYISCKMSVEGQNRGAKCS